MACNKNLDKNLDHDAGNDNVNNKYIVATEAITFCQKWGITSKARTDDDQKFVAVVVWPKRLALQ